MPWRAASADAAPRVTIQSGGAAGSFSGSAWDR
jgi:hypothetical protein